MAVPANTVTRADQVNVREHLEEAIMRSEPERTPVLSGMSVMTLKNTTGEYLREELAAPNADNAAIDGDDAVASAGHAKQRLATEPQIFTKTASTSGRADAVNTAGYSKEHSHEVGLKMIEIKRDIEAMMLSDNIGVQGTGGVASKSPGFGVQIFTNALHNGAGATAAVNAGLPTTAVTPGTARAFSGALLETAMQSAYTASGEAPPTVFVSPQHKVEFSAVPGLAAVRDTRTMSKDSESQIVGGADVYISNFGKLTVVPHYMMVGSDFILLLNQKYNRLAQLRGIRKEKLAKTGDSTRTQIIWDAGLAVLAEKGQAKIADLL